MHQGTQRVPRNTVTVAYIPYANINQKLGCIFMYSHPHSYETSIFTLGAPHEEVQGRQTKLHPEFTLA